MRKALVVSKLLEQSFLTVICKYYLFLQFFIPPLLDAQLLHLREQILPNEGIVWNITTLADGRIWAAGEKLWELTPSGWQPLPLEENDRYSCVLIPGKDDNLWMARGARTWKVNTSVTHPPQMEMIGDLDEDMWAGSMTSEGPLFIGTNLVYLWRTAAKTWQRWSFPGPGRLSLVLSAKQIWLHKAGYPLVQWRDGGWQPESLPLPGTVVGFVPRPDTPPNCQAEDLLITTEGVYVEWKERLRSVPSPELNELGLIEAICWHGRILLFSSTKGLLWLDLEAGRLQPACAKPYPVIIGCTRDRFGHLWIGGMGKVYKVFAQSGWLHQPDPDMLPRWTGFTQQRGEIWATSSQGAYLLEKGAFARHGGSIVAYQVFPGQDHTLLASHYGIKQLQGNEWREWRADKELAYRIFQTSYGLLCCRANRIDLYPWDASQPAESWPIDSLVFALQEDDHGGLWVSTLDGRLRRMDRDRSWQHVDQRKSIIPLWLHQENIWYGSDQGPMRVNERRAFPETRALAVEAACSDGRSHYLLSRKPDRRLRLYRWTEGTAPMALQLAEESHLLYPSFIDFAADSLWLQTQDTLLQIGPSQLPVVQKPRALWRKRNITDGEAVPYARRSLELALLCQNEVSNERATFRALVKKSGRTIRNVANLSGEFSFHDLLEGEYQVQAGLDGGLPLSFSFTILPPWYRHPLAYVLYGGGVLCSIWISARWQTARLRRQKNRLEQLVAVRTEELEKANSAKTLFLAHISHEIRNPLNAIVGLAESLRRQPDRTRAPEDLEALRDCAEQLSSLIEDVLDLSRIEAGKSEPRPATLQPEKLLQQTIALFRPTAEQKDLSLSLNLNGLPTHLRTDPQKLRQILHNILSNAIKFSPADGTIECRSQFEKLDPKHGLWSIVFSDSGPGFPANMIGRKLEKFQPGGTDHGKHGAGIGLALAQELVHQLHGTLELANRPGGGAQVTISLLCPFAEWNVEHSQHLPLTGGTLLIVEDLAYNRRALESMAEVLGWEPTSAATLAEGLALARKGGWKAILTDWALPDGNGLQLARALREEGNTTPIFACTAYATREQKELCLRAGMDGFLSKPVTLERLASKLQMVPPPVRWKLQPSEAERKNGELLLAHEAQAWTEACARKDWLAAKKAAHNAANYAGEKKALWLERESEAAAIYAKNPPSVPNS